MSTNHWRQWLGGSSTTIDPPEATSELSLSKYEVKFCNESETIVTLGAVWKRRGLSCHIRAIILTSQPRLLYVDPTNMELKGEVPWSRECPVKVIVDSNSKLFDVVSPLNANRAYHFEVFGQGDALAWESAINSALIAQREAVDPLVKSQCLICQKAFGFMRRTHQCQVCQRSVCADCLESTTTTKNLGQQTPQSSDTAAAAAAAAGRCCVDCAGEEARAPELLPWLSSTSFLFKLPSSASDPDNHASGDNGSSTAAGTQDSSDGRTPLQAYTATPHCNACRETFHTTTRRRQWCRHCGLMFCQACSSATFPLEPYDMYPQRVCDECAYELVRSTAAARSCQLLYLACSVFCWARCCGRQRAERWMPKERLVLRLGQIASPFGPLWGRFKLDFLKPPRPKGSQPSTVANKTGTSEQEQ